MSSEFWQFLGVVSLLLAFRAVTLNLVHEVNTLQRALLDEQPPALRSRFPKMRLPWKPQGGAAWTLRIESALGEKSNDTLLVAINGLGGESLVGSRFLVTSRSPLPRPTISHLPLHQEGEPVRIS